jgi:hypothetical protein
MKRLYTMRATISAKERIAWLVRQTSLGKPMQCSRRRA